MDGRWAPSVISGWIDQAEAWDKWMALFSADPYAGDPLAAEIVGGTYTREQPTWSRTSPGALTMSQPVRFRALPPGTTVVAIGAFDASVNGVLLFRDLLVTPRSFPTGGTFSLEAGEYVIGLDLPASP